MGGYVSHMTQHAKNGKNRPRRAGPAKGWNVKVKCGYFLLLLFFYSVNVPPTATSKELHIFNRLYFHLENYPQTKICSQDTSVEQSSYIYERDTNFAIYATNWR